MKYVDKPTDIREGQALDEKKVEAFLVSAIPGLKGPIRIQQFPSGFSNLTYAVTMGDRELVLRKPPAGKKAKSAHDMSREYNILKALKPVFPYVPEPLLYSEDPDVMGSSFYVMERMQGIILRKKLPKGMTLSKDAARKLCENLVEVFCKLHGLDYEAIGLANFGKPQGYVRRQVEGWSRRYRDAKTPDAPDYERVMQWLNDHMPSESPKISLIHNDYKFDNVVLNPENPLEIIGVLDWEMATLGDPLMDLGCSLGYWVNADDPDELQLMSTLPTNLPGMMTRQELVDYYSALSGQKVDNFDFYLCFGMFRLAVIAQQIYYRFYHGQTKDERFGLLIAAVQILERAALGVIEASGLK